MRTELAREVRMIGTRAPSTSAGRVGPRQEGEILGQHVAGFEVGHDQDLRSAGDWRVDALDLRRLRIDRIVERERPVQHPAGDLASLGHLAQRRRLDGRTGFWG